MRVYSRGEERKEIVKLEPEPILLTWATKPRATELESVESLNFRFIRGHCKTKPQPWATEPSPSDSSDRTGLLLLNLPSHLVTSVFQFHCLNLSNSVSCLRLFALRVSGLRPCPSSSFFWLKDSPTERKRRLNLSVSLLRPCPDMTWCSCSFTLSAWTVKEK